MPVDFPGGERKRACLTDLNPWSELQVLVDGDLTLRDSHAILIYLAGAQGGRPSPPNRPGPRNGCPYPRTRCRTAPPRPGWSIVIDKADTLRRAARMLPLIETHPTRHDWLAPDRPTIADGAVHPCVALAPEGRGGSVP